MASELYGPQESTLRMLEGELEVEAHARGNEVRLLGSERNVGLARRVLEELYACLRSGQNLAASDVREAIRMIQTDPKVELNEVYDDVLRDAGGRRKLFPKNLAQRHYVELIRSHDLVMAVGPAGTGKTYLAMAMAVAAMNRREVSRLVLVRPAVEAGEKLGFLPGDLVEKVNPYMRPLYDALHDLMDFGKVSRLIERDVIEVAPLAFMRGRTLNDAFVILDEAQNTTSEQMKMFLTRLGFNSKAVITGDTTQIDLPPGETSGLVEAVGLLDGIEGIGTVRFGKADVVRHPLVQSIIQAYEEQGRREGRFAADEPKGPAPSE
ncbi:MAG: PhoH family protein [Myxococcota bacterium]|nr:PhoH family protein [Myxococcota bacterium]